MRLPINIPARGSTTTPAERGVEYEAQVTGWEAAYRFPKKGARAAQTCEGCASSASRTSSTTRDDGFIMPVLEWNRYRHYTYKENRAAELVHIRAHRRWTPTPSPRRRRARERAAADLLRVHPCVHRHVRGSPEGRRPEVRAVRVLEVQEYAAPHTQLLARRAAAAMPRSPTLACHSPAAARRAHP